MRLITMLLQVIAAYQAADITMTMFVSTYNQDGQLTKTFQDGVEITKFKQKDGTPEEQEQAEQRQERLMAADVNRSPRSPQPRDENRNARMEEKSQAFEAYDCSSPRYATPVIVTPTDTDCENHSVDAVQQENVTYIVLQEAAYVKIKGRKCVRTETEISLYCGVYDHQTFIPHFTHIEKKRHVPKDDCNRWIKTGQFTDPLGKKHDLQMGRINTIKYERVGRTVMGKTHVDCYGGKIQAWGDTFNDINIFTQTKIEIRDVEYDIDGDGAIIDGTSQQLLPCTQTRGVCETERGTYVWDPLTTKQQCRYYQARMSSGIKVTGRKDQLSFFSTDGTMLRLSKLRKVTVCNREVWATNYKKIFLTDQVHEPMFQRPLHPAEMSVITYVNQQDAFLYGTLSRSIKEEFAAVWKIQCHKDRQDAREALGVKAAAQQVVAEGETTALGKGWFATAAGEVWYKYKCDRIVVRGRNTKECYSSLPVALSDKDLHRWRAARFSQGKEGSVQRGLSIREDQDYSESLPKAPEFFIEPLTRRLTTVGISAPCSTHFTPLYQNINGWWIRVSKTEGLQDTSTPQLLMKEEFESVSGLPLDLDFEYGGLYTPEAIIEMDRHAQNPRLTKDLANRIVRQTNMRGHGDLSPSNMFKELPDGLNFDVFNQLLTWMRDWGHFWSVILGVGVLIRLCTFLFGFCIRCKNGHPHPRCQEQCGRCGSTSWRIAAAIFPSLFALAPIHHLKRLPGGLAARYPDDSSADLTDQDYEVIIQRLRAQAVVDRESQRLLDSDIRLQTTSISPQPKRSWRQGSLPEPPICTAMRPMPPAAGGGGSNLPKINEEHEYELPDVAHLSVQQIQDQFVRDQRQIQDELDEERRRLAEFNRRGLEDQMPPSTSAPPLPTTTSHL